MSELLSIVVTFETFTDAMGFEKMCHQRELPGRLTPTPAALYAECGTSFKAPIEYEDAIMNAADQTGTRWDELYEVDF